MITERQAEILNSLIKEYIDLASPISSDLLKKRGRLDISGATIRNELQALENQGYVMQPHTSAGRVPTDKGYKYFVEIIFNNNETPAKPGAVLYLDLKKEIETARQKIANELELAKDLIKSLSEISTTLSYTRLQEKDSVLEILRIIGPSRTTYQKNIDVMKTLIQELENF